MLVRAGGLQAGEAGTGGMSDLLTPTEETKAKVTSGMIKAGLRSTYAAPGYQVFYEVGDDTGTRVRRHADAVVVGIWPSTGHVLHGIEIKVSRADWANEMKDPTKSWAVMRYCHRWSLITPPGLVRSDELPDNWGLMTFDGKTMRTVKQAPKLSPEPLTAGFVAALVRRAGEQDGAVIAGAVEKARTEWQAAIDRRREQQPLSKWEIEQLQRRASDAEAMVAKLKEAVPDLNAYNVDQYAAAIKAAQKAGIAGHYGGIVGLLNTMEQASARIRDHYSAAGFELPGKP